MAVKFKSKYTAQQIEDILDSIDASAHGSFVRVGELPAPDDANAALFYIYNNQVWYVNTEVEPREWALVAATEEDEENNTTADRNEGIINTDEIMTVHEFSFTDLVAQDDGSFTAAEDSNAAMFIADLVRIMQAQGKRYYTLSGVVGYGWLENFGNENNILTAKGSYNAASDTTYIQLELCDGTEVKITEHDRIFSINYVGYAL